MSALFKTILISSADIPNTPGRTLCNCLRGLENPARSKWKNDSRSSLNTGIAGSEKLSMIHVSPR